MSALWCFTGLGNTYPSLCAGEADHGGGGDKEICPRRQQPHHCTVQWVHSSRTHTNTHTCTRNALVEPLSRWLCAESLWRTSIDVTTPVTTRQHQWKVNNHKRANGNQFQSRAAGNTGVLMRGHVHVCIGTARRMVELTVCCESQSPGQPNDTQQPMQAGLKKKPQNETLHKTSARTFQQLCLYITVKCAELIPFSSASCKNAVKWCLYSPVLPRLPKLIGFSSQVKTCHILMFSNFAERVQSGHQSSSFPLF